MARLLNLLEIEALYAGTAAWWHVSRACRMFGNDIAADSYVNTRSFVEMRDAGHVLLS